MLTMAMIIHEGDVEKQRHIDSLSTLPQTGAEESGETTPDAENLGELSSKSQIPVVVSSAANVQSSDWDGPDDADNPYNWPLAKRAYHTAATGLLAFVVYNANSLMIHATS